MLVTHQSVLELDYLALQIWNRFYKMRVRLEGSSLSVMFFGHCFKDIVPGLVAVFFPFLCAISSALLLTIGQANAASKWLWRSWLEYWLAAMTYRLLQAVSKSTEQIWVRASDKWGRYHTQLLHTAVRLQFWISWSRLLGPVHLIACHALSYDETDCNGCK